MQRFSSVDAEAWLAGSVSSNTANLLVKPVAALYRVFFISFFFFGSCDARLLLSQLLLLSRASPLQFTCFTGRKVQIVTHLGGHLLLVPAAAAPQVIRLQHLMRHYLYFCTSKVVKQVNSRACTQARLPLRQSSYFCTSKPVIL